MRRLSPALAVFALLALAFPAVAAQPRDGRFRGEGTYKNAGGTYKAAVSLKVKKGKVTQFKVNVRGGAYGQERFFSPGLKVKSGGKFSGSKTSGKSRLTVRGRFTKRTKAAGTVVAKATGQDTTGYLSFPKTSFTVTRK